MVILSLDGIEQVKGVLLVELACSDESQMCGSLELISFPECVNGAMAGIDDLRIIAFDLVKLIMKFRRYASLSISPRNSS